MNCRRLRITRCNGDKCIFSSSIQVHTLITIIPCPNVLNGFCQLDTNINVSYKMLLCLKNHHHLFGLLVPLLFFNKWSRRVQLTVGSVTPRQEPLCWSSLSLLQLLPPGFTLNCCPSLTQWSTVNCEMNETFPFQVNRLGSMILMKQ